MAPFLGGLFLETECWGLGGGPIVEPQPHSGRPTSTLRRVIGFYPSMSRVHPSIQLVQEVEHPQLALASPKPSKSSGLSRSPYVSWVVNTSPEVAGLYNIFLVGRDVSGTLKTPSGSFCLAGPRVFSGQLTTTSERCGFTCRRV